jgi:hypothetical protein
MQIKTKKERRKEWEGGGRYIKRRKGESQNRHQ